MIAKRLLAAAAAVAISFPPAAWGADVIANPRGNGLIAKVKEVRNPSTGERPFHGHRKDPNRDTEPKHPCTYNGLLLSCIIPKPGRVGGTVFTPGVAREAVASIPLPGLRLHVQPDGETLVNVDTIFWTEPERFETSIDLLGHSIDVQATPSGYTWMHGDGTSQTTSDPGHPYPSRDVTHRYDRPATVGARVVTTYDVRYSIDGGGWSELDQPLVAAGPETPIDVYEAAPALAR
ncbi:MAG TPA: hypothetical protein VM093_03910 [Aeromicrobium sp.]|nr:hypothetical protein [Aeromicrobium sp.]